VHPGGDSEPPQDRFLVRLVGDAEPGLQVDALAEFSQQLGAESVDGAALHALDAVTELTVQASGDLAGGLIGEGEDADPGGIYSEPLDEVANALDETECLPRPGTSQDEQWLRGGLDGRALRSGRSRSARKRSGVGDSGDGRRRISDGRVFSERGGGRANSRPCQEVR
jgi:hypothetical protein